MVRLLIFIFIITALLSCKSKKEVVQHKEPESGTEVIDESDEVPEMTSSSAKEKEPRLLVANWVDNVEYKESALRFEITNVSLEGEFLFVDVRYGGGCKPHQFATVVQQAGSDSNAKLLLLHLTDDDRCRSFVREKIKIDLSGLKEGHSSPINFSINHQEALYSLSF